MKMLSPTAPALAAALLAAAPASADLYSEDFEAAAPGALANVSGWESTSGVPTVEATLAGNGGNGSTQAASRGTITGGSSDVYGRYDNGSAFGFEASGVGEVSFDAIDARSGTAGVHRALFGIGEADALPNNTLQFGLFSDSVRVRGYDGSLVAADSFDVEQGDWYRFRAVLDFGSGTGNLFVTNLSDGTAETLLTFAGSSDFDLGLAGQPGGVSPATWDAVSLRLAGVEGGASVAQIDNVSVAVPEPTSLAVGASGLLLLLGRRRSA